MTKRLGYAKHETWIERDTLTRNRERIIEAANDYAANQPRGRRPYSAKDLQRCVSICRRFALVKPEVLTLAGFNSEAKPRPRALPKSRVQRFKARREMRRARRGGASPRILPRGRKAAA